MTTRGQVRSVYSSGPYHGLPVYPKVQEGLTALVTGSNGLSGQYMLRVLLANAKIWKNVYALSRTPPPAGTPAADPRVKCIQVDFTSSVEAIKAALGDHGVKDVDYVFYMAYKEVRHEDFSTTQQLMSEANGAMLEDFVTALHEVQGPRMKRLVLQTGVKHYGFHFGPMLIPAHEDDPLLNEGIYEAIQPFYYRQEKFLREAGPRLGFDWAVTRPSGIIGAVAGNFMNLAVPLGLYLAVQKELGLKPEFPGTYNKFHMLETLSSAMLDAYFAEWTALTPECSNEAFNIVNGDIPSYGKLWMKLVQSFGFSAVDATAPPLPYEQDTIPPEWAGSRIEVPLPAPRDQRIHGVIETRLSLVKWAQDTKVIEAWEKMREREGLNQQVWDGASWAFAETVLGLQFESIMGVEKARKFGFFGTVDTAEDWLGAFDEARRQKMLPPKT